MDKSRLMREKRLSLKKEGYLPHEIDDEMLAYAKELGLSTERRLAPQKAPSSKMGVSGKGRVPWSAIMGQGTVRASQGRSGPWPVTEQFA